MTQSTVLMTGATGLMGSFFLKRFSQAKPNDLVLHSILRPNSLNKLENLDGYSDFLQVQIGDSNKLDVWNELIEKLKPAVILHIASIRHVPKILNSLTVLKQNPRLIIIGTTGVYSKYNQYSKTYKEIEFQLLHYPTSHCLLRPTMIYGSHKDKNLHKLIRFCDRYGFFPVFGSGQSLLQPVHADDLAKAILSVLLNPNIQGAYDLSGGTVITFLDLLALVGKLLGKPVRPLKLPYRLGVWSATLAETILARRSPVRREQILRLQEDKAYSHAAAAADFGYSPRPLEVGLTQEISILRSEGIVQSPKR